MQRLLSLPSNVRDAWVDTLLGVEDVPADMPNLPSGAVPYLPSGVEEILAVLHEVPVTPDDVFVDLGSGLGRVVMLAHLLSGARADGVELQEHLVHAARARAAELALSRVSFVHGDAARLALDGTVFFLYAPFNGEMLMHVMQRLESVARRRRIVVCAVGLELHDIAWLRQRATTSVLSLSIYESCAAR